MVSDEAKAFRARLDAIYDEMRARNEIINRRVEKSFLESKEQIDRLNNALVAAMQRQNHVKDNVAEFGFEEGPDEDEMQLDDVRMAQSQSRDEDDVDDYSTRDWLS